MENYLGNLENKIKDTKVMILLGDGIVDGRNRDGEVDIMMKQKMKMRIGFIIMLYVYQSIYKIILRIAKMHKKRIKVAQIHYYMH